MITKKETLNNYYKDNLNKLGTLKNLDNIKIKVEGKETNYFSLNKDSLKALKQFINNIKL